MSVKTCYSIAMSSFTRPIDIATVKGVPGETPKVELPDDGKEARNAVLEAALNEKMEENMVLLQQLMEKEAILKEAEGVIASVQALVDEHDEAVRAGKAKPLALPAGGGGLKAIRAVNSGPPLPVPDTAIERVSAKNCASSTEVDPSDKTKNFPLEGIDTVFSTGVQSDTDTNVRVGPKLAPFNPTNNDACDIALDLLQIGPEDILYDLGCGDARLLVRACQRCDGGFRGVGIEYDLEVFQRAQSLVSNAGKTISSQIQLHHDNVLNVDLSPASCIFVYLVPAGMKALRESLVAAIDRGVRVVTYIFSLPDVAPTQVEVYKSSTKLYLYTKN